MGVRVRDGAPVVEDEIGAHAAGVQQGQVGAVGPAGGDLRVGVTDGGTSAVVSMSGARGDTPEHILAQENAASALVDHAPCARTS
ncbi:hypothetical protein [Streptomyces sp. TLI_105]|uniref:hypothetical protein n=1 Tax=Streptomyces sp. TLI_105 TaxID=1881019 RepID=UPI000B03FCB2|nr:hypothetical protein [Streptomyces sp. TLI_105]